MKSLLLLLLFAVMTPFASGQSTVVTATVKDVTGNIYQSASVTANFQNPSNLIAKWNNFPMQAITWTTNTNSAGFFSLQLPDLNFIAPATGTFYTFRICASVVPTTPPTLPSPSVPCFTYTSPPCPNAGCISGSSIDITAAIQAVAISLVPPITSASLPLTLTQGGFANILTAAVTGARTWTLQDASDVFVFRNTTDTVANKTFDISANTLKTSTNTAGHYPRNNGTQYVDATIAAVDIPAGTSCGANNFATGINAGLAPACAQPSFANLSGTIASSQQNSATAGALGAIQLTNDLSGTAAAPTVVALHFGATQRTLSGTAPTTGQVLEFNGTNIVGATFYTNSGTCNTGSANCVGSVGVCSTTSTSGNTCTTGVPLATTEADTNYKAAIGCVTPSGFPWILGFSKSTTAVTVSITNGSASEAVVSTCAELDVVITR